MTLLQDKTGLDYSKVSLYWNNTRPSILGPYMMDGFGFPVGAGRFRFQVETGIVQDLIRGLDRNGTVLDMGSGIGYWTECFAQYFRKVISIESSKPLYEAMKRRCAHYPNVKAVYGDVMTFEPEDRYELVFLGGMLMYLNESDVITLLRKITSSLGQRGVILCRETTVRNSVVTRSGEYQAVYRSIEVYKDIFRESGLDIIKVQKNVPYVLLQMGCELIKKWKTIVPEPIQLIPVAGHILYWVLRLGNPWIVRIAEKLDIVFPELENHFFMLRASDHGPLNNKADFNCS
ncbi:trans-aconitate 2-methyltransferase [bacterium BMS3Abin06]|nr:trans-aconitate 2-methyltransferase [bacterium BMS3Abin06]HDZ01828.1 methyltransferase domain-containing protein [Nitrospirota bacterium]